jgi:hypothetical protein
MKGKAAPLQKKTLPNTPVVQATVTPTPSVTTTPPEKSTPEIAQTPPQQIKFSFIHHLSYGKVMMILNAFAGIIIGLVIALFIHWLGPLPNKEQNFQITLYNSLGWWNIIALPLFYGVLALATGVLIAGLYNFIVKKGGGIKATLLQKGDLRELKKFDVLDIGIIYTILMAVIGLFVGLLLGGVILIGGDKLLGLRIALFFIFLIIFPLIYGVLGFIIGVIMAFFYNLAAKTFGGIQFSYKEDTVERLSVKSLGLVYMMVLLYVGIIVGFLVGIIALFISIFAGQSPNFGQGVITFFAVWILVIIICVILGFLMGILGALFYNLAAKIVGGVRLRME